MQACAQGTAACSVANTPAIDLGSGTVYRTFWAPGTPRAAVVALRLTEDGSTPTGGPERRPPAPSAGG